MCTILKRFILKNEGVPYKDEIKRPLNSKFNLDLWIELLNENRSN